MSAVPAVPPDGEDGAGAGSRAPDPLRAQIFLWAVLAATALAAAPQLARLDEQRHAWPTFAVLAACAGVAQLFVVRTIRDYSLHTAAVFLIAAALLLPPELVVLMGAVQHVPAWLKLRYPWQIQAFNIANSTLNALGAWSVAHLVLRHGFVDDVHARRALAGLAACAVFVALNHGLLAAMLRLGRGYTLRQTGLFTRRNLSTELVLAGLGIGLAALWRANPWLVPFGIAPLALVHRSLHVPRLEEQARVDPKTGLFNARHFTDTLTEELSRAERFDRPLTVIMADLDLLREINNAHGHLAGDEVLRGVAEVFRAELREYDVPARFGGEEFAIMLPETPPAQALEIAERVRRAVAERPFPVETVEEPLRATVSMGVASFPADASDGTELVHRADVAVYRAKLQGRNRVVAATDEPLVLRGVGSQASPERRIRDVRPEAEAEAPSGRRAPAMVARFELGLAVVGVGVGVAGAALGSSRDLAGLAISTVAAAVARSLAPEVTAAGTGAAIAAAGLFGFRSALLVAAAVALASWSASRSPVRRVLTELGLLSLAGTIAAGLFELSRTVGGDVSVVAAAAVASAGYLLVARVEPRQLPVHGLAAGLSVLAYDSLGLYALAIPLVPLLLRRPPAVPDPETIPAPDPAEAARSAALEHANRLLRERSTAAMEGLTATLDARDALTAGHSRRVQRFALAIGRELGLSEPELAVLGQAALFHDIGKLAVPDAILLKPDGLDAEEWGLMRRHSDEGARMIDRLGFLDDAVPAIRHHHERYDGSGYPDRLGGEEIPLGARIIHVADALDSMLTPRLYRPALTPARALAELRGLAGRQFCPRCVGALERILPPAALDDGRPANVALLTA